MMALFLSANLISVKSVTLLESAYTTQENLLTKLSSKWVLFCSKYVPKPLLLFTSEYFYALKKPTVRKHLRNELGRIDSKYYYKILFGPLSFNGEKYLGKIKVLVLLLVGKENPTTHPQNKQMNEALPFSKLIMLDGVGHLLQWEKPEEVNKILLNHLSPGNSMGD
jgi:pimeloyl-ACP methyl ester carboxylesterase